MRNQDAIPGPHIRLSLVIYRKVTYYERPSPCFKMIYLFLTGSGCLSEWIYIEEDVDPCGIGELLNGLLGLPEVLADAGG